MEHDPAQIDTSEFSEGTTMNLLRTFNSLIAEKVSVVIGSKVIESAINKSGLSAESKIVKHIRNFYPEDSQA